jgi:hypothetical protein
MGGCYALSLHTRGYHTWPSDKTGDDILTDQIIFSQLIGRLKVHTAVPSTLITDLAVAARF